MEGEGTRLNPPGDRQRVADLIEGLNLSTAIGEGELDELDSNSDSIGSGSSSAVDYSSSEGLVKGTDLTLPMGWPLPLQPAMPDQLLHARLTSQAEELGHMDRHRKLLEDELERQQHRHAAQVKEIEARWQGQLNEVGREAEAARSEASILQARLDDRKDLFRSLEMSEGMAQELRRQPESDLTLKDYVLLKAHEMVDGVKKQLERVRLELERTQEQLRASTESSEMQLREGARARRLQVAREEGLEVEVGGLQSQLTQALARAAEAEQRAGLLLDKGRRFDEVESRAAVAERQLEECRQAAQDQATVLEQLAESEKSCQKHAAEQEQRASMLDLDKQYLLRQLSATEAQRDKLEREVREKSQGLAEMGTTHMQMTHELSTLREQKKTEYEDKLLKEVEVLRAQSEQRLQEVTERAQGMYDRENQVLRDAKSEASSEAARLRSELSDLSRTHQDVILRMSKLEGAHEAALSELRSEARLKGFEAGQLGLAYEQQGSQLRERELELDMQREAISAHRVEFTRLSAAAASEVSELKLLLEAERSKVKLFEEMELELDTAIVRVGADTKALDRMPTAPQRRVRHAIQLAQKLLEKERKLEETQAALTKAEASIAKLEQEGAELKQHLEDVDQPTRYMVEKLRDRDRELSVLKSEKLDAEKKVEALTEAHRAALEEQQELRAELQRVLHRREDLEATRQALLQVREYDSKSKAASVEGNNSSVLLLTHHHKRPPRAAWYCHQKADV